MSAAPTVALYHDASKAWGLLEADALLLLAKLPDRCVDAVITDPPYGISFKDAAWDGADIRGRARARGEWTSAGEAFERWTAAWAGQCCRVLKPGGHLVAFGAPRTFHRLVSGIEDGGLEVRDQLLWLHGQGMPKSRRMRDGQGTALKPAYEPVVLARAPFTGTAERNVARWGTGALNITAAQIPASGRPGRWPANVALSHGPDCPVDLLDGVRTGPSRFYYCAKTSRAEREAGCQQLPRREAELFTDGTPRIVRNVHPTVKPIELMRWLVRLTCPPGGLVLDPFTGSGSTGAAAVLERRTFLGIEREADYVDIACARLYHWAAQAAQEEVLP